MQVLIGRSFYYEKDDRIFVKGKSYSVNNKLANWIARKRLGEIIPVVSEDHKVKNLEKAPKDKMIKNTNAMRK
jgi:hypothetical protein